MKAPPTLADSIIREWQKPDYRELDPNNWLATHVAQARKFVLDESMSAFLSDLAYASLLTCDNPHKAKLLLESMRTLARLPHASVWIEYDHMAKRKRAKEEYAPHLSIDPDDMPDKSGWLLMQHPQLETAFMAIQCTSHCWSGTDKTVRLPTPQTAFFAYSWTCDDGVPPWPRDHLFSKTDLMEIQGGGFFLAKPEGILTGVGTYTSDSVAVIPAPHIVREAAKVYTETTSFNSLGELSGDLRFLWALLGCLNDLPTTMVGVRQDRGYYSKGRYRKFCDHTVVSITVPTKRWRRLAQRAIAISRRRAHEVRGHFRDSRFHPGEKIWVRPHVRGDATLGWVDHDYHVAHKI